MKTAEQIAEPYVRALMADGKAASIHRYSLAQTLVNAIREAQREALSPGAGHEPGCYPDPSHPGYWMCTGKGHPQGPIEPQFAPEGVPDKYRDGWEHIECQPDYLADAFSITVESRVTAPYGDGAHGSETFTVTQAQARHILADLSEQNRLEGN